MEYLKLQSFFLVILVLHQSQCQQQSSYNPQSQTKVQLEDIERDNLKSAQVTASPPVQTQQYFPYSSQDQLLYNIPSQQPYPLFPTAQQPATASPLYPAAPQQAALFSPQQQQLLYYTQAQQPTIDFSGQYYQVGAGGFPYIVPQTAAQAAVLSPNAAAAAEYYKSLQLSQPKVNQAAPATLVKTIQAQIPSTFLLQQPLYQPYSLPQPQNPQYYAYNSFYQLQTPTKSVLGAGVKSTTPTVPIKGKDEFVPIGGNSYRIEYPTQDQLNSYNKARLSG